MKSLMRQSKYDGVVGYISFTLNDPIIEQCGYDDVSAYGSFAVVRLRYANIRN